MFLRGGKENTVKYGWSIVVKDESVITLQITQQPKIENINVVPGQLFSRQCKAKFLLDTDSL